MAKHVYPPWYKGAQRALFVVAAVLLITFPTLYGRRLISVTALVLVLGVFFGFWLAFSLGARYLLPSYTRESTLPIHTHAPLPPIVLHSPKPDAVPAAPAIRIHSAYDQPNPATSNGRPRARFGDNDNDQEQDGKTERPKDDDSPPSPHQHQDSTSEHHLQTPAQCTQARFGGADVEDAGSGGEPSANGNGNNVKFQTRARGYTADSTNSEVYPTFATYRQAQHTNFDAFAQRIRRAFVAATEAASHAAANSSHSNNSQPPEEGEARQSGASHEGGEGGEGPGAGNKDKSGGLLSVTDNQHGSVRSSSSIRGRPRSTSAASMISNLSEKMKLGNLFGRSSTSSRRGSDASSLIPPPGMGGGGNDSDSHYHDYRHNR